MEALKGKGFGKGVLQETETIVASPDTRKPLATCLEEVLTSQAKVAEKPDKAFPEAKPKAKEETERRELVICAG